MGWRHRRDPPGLRGSPGITVLAGGTAQPDATEFTLKANKGAELYAIGENQYLAITGQHAELRGHHHHRREHLVLPRDDDAPDGRVGRTLAHTDHNTLHRVG